MGKKKKKTKIPRSLQKKRRERNRTRQDAARESMDKLIARTRKGSTGKEIVRPSPGEIKMSDVIHEFAEPLLESAKTFKEKKGAISIAILAWNMTLLPEKDRADSMEKLMRYMDSSGTDPESDAENREIMDYLIARKYELFPDITRAIMDYDMVDTPDGLHLNVAYTYPDKREAKAVD